MDLVAAGRLHELSMRLVSRGDQASLLQDIVDAAVELTGADAGNAQLLERHSDDHVVLRLSASRGLDLTFQRHFDLVDGADSACGVAMQHGGRVVVEDVVSSPVFTEEARRVILDAGFVAVQSTPMRSRSGELLGMLSTHYRDHAPTRGDLRLIDLLARQAADWIERMRADERARRSAEQLHAIAQATLAMGAAPSIEAKLQICTERVREITGTHQCVISVRSVGGEDGGHREGEGNWSAAVTSVSLSDKYKQWRDLGKQVRGTGIFGEVSRSNRPVRLTHEQLLAHPAWRGSSEGAEGHPPLRGCLAAPLVGGDGRNIGVVQVSDKHAGEFTGEDESILVQLAQYASAVIEAAQGQQALSVSQARYRNIVNHTITGVVQTDAAGRITFVNRCWCEMLGYSEQEMLGLNITDLTDPVSLAQTREAVRRLAEGGPAFTIEKCYRRKDGGALWATSSVNALRGPDGEYLGLSAVVLDIGSRKRAETLQTGLAGVLERIARGEPLPEVLHALIQVVESVSEDGMVASVLLLDRDRAHLRHGAAPSLPEAYNQAVDGIAIGPRAGSCGTAVYRREPVYVCDIATDPLWDDFRHVAVPCGLRACWSTPILSSEDEVLGTFALYYREPQESSPQDSEIIRIATRTAAVAIERARVEAALRESGEQFRRAVQDAPIPVMMHAEDGEVLQLSHAWSALTGYGLRDTAQLRYWLSQAYGSDVADAVRGVFDCGGTLSTDFEFDTRAGDRRTWSLSASSPGTLRDGRRFVIAMALDITERKQAQRRNEFLLRLDAALRMLVEPETMLAAAGALLRGHLDADRVIFAEVHQDEDHSTMLGDFRRGDMPAMRGARRIGDFGGALLRAMLEDRVFAIEDAESDPRIAGHIDLHRAVHARASLSVPLHKGGRLAAVLAVHRRVPRAWVEDETELCRIVAHRCWESIERARVTRALADREGRYRALFDSVDQGYCVVEVLLDDAGEPVDYRFLETNPAFVDQTDLHDAEGKTMRALVPGLEQGWVEAYARVALTGEPARFEASADAMGRWFDVYACRIDAPHLRHVAILFRDISGRKREELNLEFLSKVSRELSVLTDAHAIMRTIGAMMRLHFGLLWLTFGEVDEAAEHLRLVYRTEGAQPEIGPGPHRFSDFVSEPFLEALRAGEVVVVDDVASDPRTVDLSEAYMEHGVRSQVVVPFFSEGHWKFVLAAHRDHVSNWQSGEVDLLRELTARIHLRLERADAEAALRESERRFASIFNQAGGGISYTDVDGRFSMVNDRYCEIVGHSREQLIGMLMQDLVHPEDLPVSNLLFERMLDNGQAFAVDHRCVQADGSMVWVSSDVSPIKDHGGAIVAAMTVTQDITRRKRVEDRDRLLVAVDDAAMPLGDPDEIALAVVRVLGEHLKLDGAAYVEVDADEDWETVVGNYSPGLPSMAGRFRLSDFGEVLHDAMRAGRPFWEDDVEHEGLTAQQRERYATLQIRAILAVPLRKDGRLVATVSGYQATPRTWSDDDIEWTRLVANRCWESIERARAMRGLAENEERLRVALDTGRLGSWELRLPGRDFSGDELCRAHLGLPAHAPLDYTRLLDQLVHPDDREFLKRQVMKAVTQVEDFDAEFRATWPDGSLHWIIARGRVFYDPAGEPTRVAGVSLDITDRKRAEEALRVSEERASLALTVAKLGTWSWEPAPGTIRVDARTREICGLEPHAPPSLEEIAARIHPEDRPRVIAALKAATRPEGDGRYGEEFRWVHRDGSIRWAVSRGQTLFDHEAGSDHEHCDETPRRPLLMLGSVLDITERKQTEESLRDIDRRKDEFLATLAHELRNPLAPIRNCLHILRMKHDDEPDAAQLHDMMERQVKHLVRLVDDLMEVSRVTRGNIELRCERVDLSEVVRNAVETSKPLIDAGQHHMEIELPDEPLPLHVDPVRMSQVFANLLNNAAKYSDSGGRITLAARREGDFVVVSVRDNGLGIAPHMLPRVFDMFAQIDQSRGYAQGGLGIGLTLVRSLVALHDGQVEARSAGLGHGSEFVVRLPLHAHRAVADDPAEHEGNGSQQMVHRILVVDDNHESADSLALFLRISGHEVRAVYGGSEGIEATASFRPDVVLLDLGMPQPDGHEVCRQLREQPWGADIVLIAVTGWGQNEDRRRSEQSGFDAHVVKPVEPAALMALVDSLRRLKRRQRAAP
ncbi:MAG: PAS domain S-box protein [Proteobacteria bacterium]|nr:PAS domain S-box protein [Pseudomonadota bacterium]